MHITITKCNSNDLNDLHGGSRGVDVGVANHILLQNVILNSAYIHITSHHITRINSIKRNHQHCYRLVFVAGRPIPPPRR